VDLVADENVDAPIVAALRGADHRVIYARELHPGIDDARLLEMANSHGALLLTSDKDFGELVFRQGLVHAGVILYRLVGLATERKAGVLLSVLQTHGDALRGAFTTRTFKGADSRSAVPLKIRTFSNTTAAGRYSPRYSNSRPLMASRICLNGAWVAATTASGSSAARISGPILCFVTGIGLICRTSS
jgi:predicted nuclease of predicted toxin-antitoxin system